MEPKIRSFGPPFAKLWPNISIYFDIFYEKLVCSGRYIKNKNCFANDRHWTTPGLRSEPEHEKWFFRTMWFFGDVGFPSVNLVNKSLKALGLSSKMVYQHLLYLLSWWTYWHLKLIQGPTHFFTGNFRGCLMADFTSWLQWAETAAIYHPITSRQPKSNNITQWHQIKSDLFGVNHQGHESQAESLLSVRRIYAQWSLIATRNEN